MSFEPRELTTPGKSTDSLMDAYLSELVARGDYARHFADDATITIMGTDQEGKGRAAVEQMIRYLHQQAFDATVERKNLFATDSHAALEAEFVGTHIGEFAGIPATGRHVQVPYSVVYDVADGRITALRAYMSLDALVSQIR